MLCYNHFSARVCTLVFFILQCSSIVHCSLEVLLASQRGDSAVILATVYRHLPILRELVRAGADLNRHNQVVTVILHCV